MARVHERTLEFAMTMNAAADTVALTALNYYRTDAELAAANPFALTISTVAAQTSPADVLVGELIPPPTRIRFTFSAF